MSNPTDDDYYFEDSIFDENFVDETPETPSPRPKRVKIIEDPATKLKRRAIYGALLAIGFGLMIWVSVRNDGSTTDLSITNTEGLEELIPNRGDEVLRQNDVGADLAPGYRGQLSINGVEIPDNYIRRGPDNPLNEVITRPGVLGRDAAGEETLDPVFKSLDADTNCAEITIWPEERPEDTETVRWCFQAT